MFKLMGMPYDSFLLIGGLYIAATVSPLIVARILNRGRRKFK